MESKIEIIKSFILRRIYRDKYIKNFLKIGNLRIRRKKNNLLTLSSYINSKFIKLKLKINLPNKNLVPEIIDNCEKECDKNDYIILFSVNIFEDHLFMTFIGLDYKISKVINSLNYFFS
tara:strand:- start:118 stop:474 length:357 start_codon:yes stop_codon:yes gene_type:complete